MRNITVRLPEGLTEDLEAEADEHDRTRSEHVRNTLETRHEHADEVTEYEERRALETENERLQRQLATTNQRIDEHKELVRYAEAERAYREAGIGTRMKWWLFGRDR